MNTLLQTPASSIQHPPSSLEPIDIRHDNDDSVRRATGYPANQGSTVPLWQQARARTIGFRRDDLSRTHWRKVWRSMRDA